MIPTMRESARWSKSNAISAEFMRIETSKGTVNSQFNDPQSHEEKLAPYSLFLYLLVTLTGSAAV